MNLPENLLRGSYVPLVTPFRDGDVDYDAFAGLVELHRRAGSDGVVVCGTSGEPATLSLDERQRLAEVAVAAADGDLPVVVASGSQSLAESARLTEHAAECGAAATMIVTPYYVLPPQRGLVEYYRRLGALSDVPMVLYHIPRRTGLNLGAEQVVELVQACPTLVGIKHSSADLGVVSHLIDALGPEFRVLCGLEDLTLPMLMLGASGAVSAVANVAPRLVAALCRAVGAGDLATARTIHYRLLELNESVFWDTNPIAIKYALTRIGALERNEHRPPMAPATPALEGRLDEVLKRAGITDAFAEP